MQVGIGYWAPYLLATASAVLLGFSVVPPLISDAALFKRWYQTLLIGGTVLLVGGVVLSVVASSPLILVGIVLIGAAVGAWQTARMRSRGKLAEEALEFLHGLIAVMSAQKGLREALRTIARDPDFYAAYPRMTETVREVVASMQAGTPLSEALTTVAETSGASRPVWQQMATIARIAESGEERASVQEQVDALEVSWEILFDVQAINQTLKQEMGSMEMAKWVFTLVLPGMNVFMFFMVDGYQVFFNNLIGKVVLGLEVMAIIGIFVIFSRLQKLPEVRL
jgi:Flp pilus assembly protein TadB